ncbi:helix-turn-helix domain-containing protein [Enterobacter intestinihominis]
MPKKKKLVPNSGKSISEIQQLPGNTYTENGVSSLTFAKHNEYFKDINCIYSEEYPEGKMLELVHIVLYCRFQSFQANGKKCYESQGKLGQICKCDPGTIGDKVKELVKMGLVITDEHPDPNISSLLYTALPLTDAHVIPPDQLPAAPIIVSAVKSNQPAQMPAPEPVKAAEEQSVPDDDLPCVGDDPDYQSTPTIPTQQDKPELPWGGRKGFKTNGDPADEGVQWALTETMGDEEKAYQLLSRVLSEYFGRAEVFTPRTTVVYDEFGEIPF